MTSIMMSDSALDEIFPEKVNIAALSPLFQQDVRVVDRTLGENAHPEKVVTEGDRKVYPESLILSE